MMKKRKITGFILLLCTLSVFSYTLLEQRDWLFDGDFILLEGQLVLGKPIVISPLTLYPVFLIHRLDYRFNSSDDSETAPRLLGMEMTPYALIVIGDKEQHIRLISASEGATDTEAVNYAELMALSEKIRKELYRKSPAENDQLNDFELLMIHVFAIKNVLP